MAPLAAWGCAGAQIDIVAPTARVPVAITRALPVRDGLPVREGAGLEQVGSFTHASTHYGFFYGATRSTLDLSEAVNAQVGRAGGEGITSLRIDVEHCALNYVFPLTLLPFWPGCEEVTVAGTIVKRSAP